MQTVELAILDWIQQNLRCDFLDVVLPAISWTTNHGEVWILLAVVLCMRGKRRWGVSVACALILDLISCNIVLKPLIGRLRPCYLNTAVELLIKAPTSGSFPSGHTASSFAAVFALKAAGSPLWRPALIYAGIVAFSRMYLYVHWPTDILGGALVGWLCGWLGAKLVEKAAQAIQKRKQS